ncbi:MAG: glycosyltransferase family 4 protein [Actinobacteria bacterium]|nr:glycosyltransferase family 4 protein [Actinomycetota bacterium]
MRVLHVPTATGGHPTTLARAEREIGLESWSIVDQETYLAYPADEVVLRRDANRLWLELHRPGLLFRACRDFDVIHFNAGQTLMPQPMTRSAGRHAALPRALHRAYARVLEQRDLPLLRALGKAIVVTFQGDDARRGDVLATRPVSPLGEVEPGYYDATSDRLKQRRVARFARHADRILALNPDLLDVLPPGARFVPYANVDPRDWQPVAAPPSEAPLVLHAPSHRGVKGTRHVLEAVRTLEQEGVPFRFRLVERVSHAEARRLYEQADLLVDQLLVGWYGGLAVELMLLGKPVVAYVADADLARVPDEMRDGLPVVRAEPSSLTGVLRTLLTERRHELPRLGQRSRAWAERWHDPVAIARMMEEEYRAALAAVAARRQGLPAERHG